MQFDRAAGVLLHITSLPGDELSGDFGVGDLGESARRFVDFLQLAGQRVWQVLPLGPTVHGDSPYSCYSAFAGNPTLISLVILRDEGLLTDAELAELRLGPADRDQITCDYLHAHDVKRRGLKLAFDAFRAKSDCEQFDQFESYCTKERWWLDDFALFTALMKHFGTDDWSRWDVDLVKRSPAALGQWKEKLAREYEFEQFVQFVFTRQWDSLREYAHNRNVKIFGDMPIFIAHGSADVWANQKMFRLDEQGKPTVVAGVPPDYFSKTGQLWGNPLYDWEALEQTGYRWWIDRFRSAFDFFDLLRIDHFRGFEAFWEVPTSARTAVSGRWVKGPGEGPFLAARKALGELEIVAEDLGLITEEVIELRDALEFPGMRVLQFGFDNEHDLYHRPEDYPESCVAYTGTHDNSTILAWYNSRLGNEVCQELLQPYLELSSSDLPMHWRLIDAIYRSKAFLAIAPLQDLLGLDDDCRMNTPGLADGNWAWRCLRSQLTTEVAGTLRLLTETHTRNSGR